MQNNKLGKVPPLLVSETSDFTGAKYLDITSRCTHVKLSPNPTARAAQLPQLTAALESVRVDCPFNRKSFKSRGCGRDQHTEGSNENKLCSVWTAEPQQLSLWVFERTTHFTAAEEVVFESACSSVCRPTLTNTQTADCWICVVAHWELTVVTVQSGHVVNREPVMCSGTTTPRPDWQ